jgi:hypothetical protein
MEFRSHVGLAIALGLSASPVVGQTPALQGSPPAAVPSADSAKHLNQLGRWRDALSVAAVRMPVASADEKCSLRIDILISLQRMGLLDGAASEFKTFDPQCGASPAVRERSAEVARVRSDVTLPPLPATGLDFSGVDEFWRVADLLAKDIEPSEDDWRRLASSVGYRMSLTQVGTTRSDMDIALRPSRRAEFDSLTKLPGDQAGRLSHLARAVRNRPALSHYRDSVSKSLPVQQAVTLASRYLPPHATEGKEPPLVAFAIFRDDAYSNGPRGVIVDLDHVYVSGALTLLLAHEFHHSYLAGLSAIHFPSGNDPSVGLVRALNNARNEGIADLIDKPHPLVDSTSPEMIAYAKRYNAAYDRTPEVIHSIDSALVVAADDSTKLRAVGARVQELLPSNGHYNGSYVAREIYETFGVDSLFPGVSNPFAFWRVYAEAEVKRGNPPPFSPKSVTFLNALEKKYLTPSRSPKAATVGR